MMFGVIGGIAEALIVGIAGVAGVYEENAPAPGRLHRLLQGIPGHHCGATQDTVHQLRISGQEAVA
jgi:hypothetical protein